MAASLNEFANRRRTGAAAQRSPGARTVPGGPGGRAPAACAGIDRRRPPPRGGRRPGAGRRRARAPRRAALSGCVSAGVRLVESGGHRPHVHRRGAAAHSRRCDRRPADRRAARHRRLVGACRQIRIAVRQCLDLGSDADRGHAGTRSGHQDAMPRDGCASSTRKAGEPLVRLAVRRAMRIIGGEFVVGRSIEEALARSAREPEVGLCSFDMLGEGARTLEDAERYLRSYEHAIDVIGAAGPGRAAHQRSSISIKLSALEPRYSLLQQERVMQRLVPQVRGAGAARGEVRHTAHHRCRRGGPPGSFAGRDRGARRRFGHPRMAGIGPRGAGVFQTRAGRHRVGGGDRALERQADDGAAGQGRLLGQRDQARPGARARELSGLHAQGHHRRVLSGLCRPVVQACRCDPARSSRLTMRTASPRFWNWLRQAPCYEFQRLHGMGRLLYAEAARQVANFPQVRVYAPVGEHKDLLAYLVRRLLENGANTSFVNRFMDEQVPVADIVRDPISELERLEAYPHPRLPNPPRAVRRPAQFRGRRYRQSAESSRRCAPGSPAAVRRSIVAGPSSTVRWCRAAGIAVTNPADRRDQVGNSRDATPGEIAAAFEAGERRAALRGTIGAARRARSVSTGPRDLLEQSRVDFYELLVREAGKTLPDAIAEVREAVDFCRYYAHRARVEFAGGTRLEGPTGELNELSLHGRGVFACISPWNFPLAIFAGQVTAALAAGNARRREARRADAVDRRALRAAAARGGRRARGAAAHSRAGTAVRRGGIGTWRARRGRDDGIHRDRAHHQPAAGGTQRRHRTADRRDRRLERHAGRFDRSAGAGGRRCGELGFHERRPALLGAAAVVSAGGDRRYRFWK